MRMTPKEVVAMLAIHEIYVDVDTVRAWCSRGVLRAKPPRTRQVLKSSRVGGRILILETSVRAFLPMLKQARG